MIHTCGALFLLFPLVANTTQISVVAVYQPGSLDRKFRLGRGRPIVRYQGNIRFRKLIQNRMKQYRDACRHVSKDLVAQDVVDVVLARGGRFLRRVESEMEATELCVPPGIDAWIQVDRDAAIGKCKQAFRDEKRANSVGRELGETQGPDLSERSSDRAESTADVAANVSAAFIRNPHLSSALGSSSVLELARLQQQQKQSLQQKLTGLPSLYELNCINPSMLQNANSQAEIELLLLALQANQSTSQIQQSSVTDQKDQFRAQLQALTSIQGQRWNPIDYSLNLLRPEFPNNPGPASGAAAMAQAFASGMGFNPLPCIQNQQTRSAPMARRAILNMLSPEDGLRLAGLEVQLQQQQQQQQQLSQIRSQPSTQLGNPYLDEMLAPVAPASTAVAGQVPTGVLPAANNGATTTSGAGVTNPSDIQNERARLADVALRRYQSATLGYFRRDSESPKAETSNAQSDRESRSDGGSATDSTASTGKKPAARLYG